jgi:serine/threonine protein kinase
MAPEQARGDAVDQRADLFALGSTVYAMCTGQAPFRGESGMAVIRQVCDVDPRPIRTIDPEVPAWLEGIVRKLHAKEPAGRFQSAAEVGDLLERCLAHVQHPDRHPLPAVACELGQKAPDPLPRQSSRRQQPGMLAALVLVLLCGAALLTLPWSPRPAAREKQETADEVSDFNPPFLSEQSGKPDNENLDQMGSDLNQLRNDLGVLRRSMTESVTEDRESVDPAFADAVRRAARIEHNLHPQGEPAADPVATQMEAIRQRLEALRQQLGASPE